MALQRRITLSRRALLAGAATGCALLGRSSRALAYSAAGFDGTSGDPWHLADLIVDHPAWLGDTPERRSRELRQFYVTAFGAAQCELVDIPLIHTSSASNAPGLAPAPGSPDNYPAFAAAIAACHRAGRGRVIVPAGNWYCAGPITLLSNVNFQVRSGAQIWFSPTPADYAKYGPYDLGTNGKLVRTRWQGNDCYNFSPMV
jgi:polygalacturonase